MNRFKHIASYGLMAAMGVATPAMAAGPTDVTNDILPGSTADEKVWTLEESPIVLRETIFIGAGASLTIEAGVTVVTGDNDDGGIVVEPDAQIFAMGTKDQPIIMTSLQDVATWNNSNVTSTDGDPEFEEITALGDRTTGSWRPAVQEWRNITMLGNAIVSSYSFEDSPRTGADNNANLVVGTAADPNQVQMEGLLDTEGSNPPGSVFYGGANDDDDSGVLNFVSSRYGGRVLGEGNELNGMSLGGIGRGTDISNVEIMNNVDDGIEVWGGTVDLKHFTIWNIGDDSLDFDQGWRGRAQFGLIVQGYSVEAEQGSGVGDNAIEFDGAEDSDGQPRSTVTAYNLTVIGQPGADGMTTWRDNARSQFRKSVFMSPGESLVRLDDSDGDGGEGYGFNGTHTWSDVWNTDETNISPNGVNDGTGDFSPASLYTAQQSDGVSANLAAIEDSVFWDVNTFYTNQSHLGTPRGGNFDPSTIFDPAQNGASTNVDAGSASANRPIQGITRDSLQIIGADNVTIARVLTLDPRAANDATSASSNPSLSGNDFWSPTPYRGAFSDDHNWADGWTAADTYGFFPGDQRADDPETDFAVQITTTEFQTQNGETYIIECSTDGKAWEPVAQVTGDGSLKTVANTISVDQNKIYRVRVQ